MTRASCKRWLGLLGAAVCLHLILITPNHPIAPEVLTVWMMPLELPIILLTLVLLPAASGVSQSVRLALVVLLTLIVVFKAADFATYLAFNRPFNLVVDWNLVMAGLHTLAESIGYGLALMALLGILMVMGLLAWLLWLATGAWLRLEPNPGVAKLILAGLVASSTLATVHAAHVSGQWRFATEPPGDTSTLRMAWRYLSEPIATLRSLQAFEKLVTTQPVVQGHGLLEKLKGYDVLIIYIESYGRSSIDNPLYANTHVATLRKAQARLAAKGLATRSGWLTAPMVGGQSWLAHSSMASGLWISDQGRYRGLIASGRSTLFDDARAAGFKTVAIMPAIRLTWPEGEYFGFDAIYPSQALGYEGLPFNWVTMPDQYALAALDRLERSNPANTTRGLFAQVVLSSSHAPFTPVPTLLPWDQLGQGRVFNAMAQSGESPQAIWSDAQQVRLQYKQAIDYSLQTVFDYIAHHTDNNTERNQVVFVLGDHQPARFISGTDNLDVAMHVIGPADALAHIESWDFTPGLIPAPELPAWRMDEFRARFVQAFSQGSAW